MENVGTGRTNLRELSLGPQYLLRISLGVLKQLILLYTYNVKTCIVLETVQKVEKPTVNELGIVL